MRENRKERKTNMKSYYERAKEVKDRNLAYLASEHYDKLTNVDLQHKELYRLLRTLQTEGIDTDNIEFDINTWYKKIMISEIEDTDTFEQVQITLTELYGDAKKSKGYSDSIDYAWRHENIDIELNIDRKLSGCKLIEETVWIPENVVKGHNETTTKVVCD